MQNLSLISALLGKTDSLFNAAEDNNFFKAYSKMTTLPETSRFEENRRAYFEYCMEETLWLRDAENFERKFWGEAKHLKDKNLRKLHNQISIGVIFHNRDMDGYSSAAVFDDMLKDYLEYNNNLNSVYNEIKKNKIILDYIGYNYEKENHILVDYIQKEGKKYYDAFVFLDTTPTDEFIIEVNRNSSLFIPIIIFDHHTKRLNELKKYEGNIFKIWQPKEGVLESAVQVVYNYFDGFLDKLDYNPNTDFLCWETIKNSVKLISSYDTWKFDEEGDLLPLYLNTYFFEKGLGGKDIFGDIKPINYERIIEFTKKEITNNPHIIYRLREGREIYEEELAKTDLEGIVHQINDNVVIVEDKSPTYAIQMNVYEDYSPDNIFVYVMEKRDSEYMQVSLRTKNNNIDLNDFIKIPELCLTGGGHKQAAGATLHKDNYDKFKEYLINIKKIDLCKTKTNIL